MPRRTLSRLRSRKTLASRNAYNNLGLVYWRQRKYEEAAAQFSKQIIINPQDHYAHRNLGMMLRDQKKCSDAMPELQKALAITPNHPETLLAEGECDLDLGNRAKGISELQQATEHILRTKRFQQRRLCPGETNNRT